MILMDMDLQNPRERRAFEIMLVLVCLGMTTAFYVIGEYAMVALNLFFLPVLLCGYYLGRNSAGVLALLCVLSVAIVTTTLAQRFVGFNSVVMTSLALAVWAASLGLSAILIGTLCDERARTVNDLHRAYVGVVEVLSKYLQSSNPETKARSIRISELCQLVARQLRMSRKQIDDIRVAALLRDLESVEVSTQLISKAVSAVERKKGIVPKHTFLGTDLVHSLGSVLEGALPLIVSQNEEIRDVLPIVPEEDGPASDVALGSAIILAVRRYESLTAGDGTPHLLPAEEALRKVREETPGKFARVVDAIALVTRQKLEASELATAGA